MRIDLRDGQWAEVRDVISHGAAKAVVRASRLDDLELMNATTMAYVKAWDVKDPDGLPVPFYALDGTTAASAVYRPNHRTWTATIVRQFANDTEWDIYGTKATRKVRIRTTGPALGGSNYKIDLDLYGVYTGRSWSEVDGIITEELTLEPIFDTGTSTSHSLTVVNATASIT